MTSEGFCTTPSRVGRGQRSKPARRGRAHRLGYARVSTAGQNLDSQRDALRAAGCRRIFEDTISGTSKERPGWDALMDYARAGDTLVIAELSRMSRSLLHLLQVVAELEEREIEIVSLRENIDTSTATGRLFLSIMGAVSQMERELRAERAAAGRAAARARGRSGGRPRTPREKLDKARRLYESKEMTAAEAAAAVGISRRRLFNHLAEVRRADDTSPSKTSESEPSEDGVVLRRFGKGAYRWRNYVVEPNNSLWLVREHLDEAGAPIPVEGSPHTFGKGRRVQERVAARVRTLDAARRLLGGELVERAFYAEGLSASGNAKLAKLDSARWSGNAATYGWKHLVVSRGASGLWTIDALWTLDSEPADAVLEAQRARRSLEDHRERPEHDRLEVVEALREARTRVPDVAERSLRERDQLFVRLRRSQAAAS